MNAKQTISETQKSILMTAAHRAGKIELPETLKGSARNMVLNSLEKRALIVPHDDTWKMSLAGYDAINLPHPKSERMNAPVPKPEVQVSEPKPQKVDATTAVKTIKHRENSKQATVIEMLKRECGATNSEICKETGWQTHTVRGMMAGTLGKKLGLVILSDKEKGQERVYYIPTPEELAEMEMAIKAAEKKAAEQNV